LLHAFQNGDDAEARNDMSVTSMMGGLALANAGLGAVHGFAGPLGGMFPAPHGATCASLLPHVMRVNLSALEHKDDAGDLMARFDEVARILTGDQGARAIEGIEWLSALCTKMEIPGLATYGLTEADFPDLVEKASVSSSMKGNPVPLSSEEMVEILELAI
jgi:alcohol dehydrogenase class IV